MWVAVLFAGTSEERDVSIASGAQAIRNPTLEVQLRKGRLPQLFPNPPRGNPPRGTHHES